MISGPKTARTLSLALLAALSFCVMLPLPLTAQETPDDIDYIEDDFSPGLGLFALFMIILLIMLIGAGAAITVCIVFITWLLAVLGILTTSTLAGVFTKKPQTAVKAFFLQLGGILGLAAGAGVTLAAAKLCGIQYQVWALIAFGGTVGIAAGLLLAALFNLVWEKFLNFLMSLSRN